LRNSKQEWLYEPRNSLHNTTAFLAQPLSRTSKSVNTRCERVLKSIKHYNTTKQQLPFSSTSIHSTSKQHVEPVSQPQNFDIKNCVLFGNYSEENSIPGVGLTTKRRVKGVAMAGMFTPSQFSPILRVTKTENRYSEETNHQNQTLQLAQDAAKESSAVSTTSALKTS
jgi:hypothetical protein